MFQWKRLMGRRSSRAPELTVAKLCLLIIRARLARLRKTILHGRLFTATALMLCPEWHDRNSPCRLMKSATLSAARELALLEADVSSRLMNRLNDERRPRANGAAPLAHRHADETGMQSTRPPRSCALSESRAYRPSCRPRLQPRHCSSSPRPARAAPTPAPPRSTHTRDARHRSASDECTACRRSRIDGHGARRLRLHRYR